MQSPTTPPPPPPPQDSNHDTAPSVSWFDMTYDQRWSPSSLALAAQVWSLSCTLHLEELRVRLQDMRDYPLNHPLEVARCYVTAHRNIDEAEASFRQTMTWRQQEGIDALVNDNSASTPLLQKYYPSCFLEGTDLQGDAIWLDRTGAGDCVALHHHHSVGATRFRDYTLRIREQGLRGAFARDYEQKHGRPPARLTVLMDMEGLCRRHLHADMIQPLEEGIRILQEYYGGMAKRILIINAPFVFRIVWSIAQHFCNESLKKSIILCNPRNSKAILEKYVDRAVLPPCMGGTGRPGVGMPQDMTGGILPPELLVSKAAEEDNEDGIPGLMKSQLSAADTVTSLDSFSYDTQESSSLATPTSSPIYNSSKSVSFVLQPQPVTVRTMSLLRGSFQHEPSIGSAEILGDSSIRSTILVES